MAIFRLPMARRLRSVDGMRGKSDLEIAREARLKPITEMGAAPGLLEDELECFGRHKAKINRAATSRLEDKPTGRNSKLSPTKSMARGSSAAM
jgi:formyltetrahydrofolate synthetase